MTAGAGPRGAVALLLAGALTLHIFMLSHGHDTPNASTAVDAAGDAAPESAHTAAGHQADEGEGAGEMAAFCFSVLVGAALTGMLLVRPRSLAGRATAAEDAEPGGPRPRRVGGGARDGPSWAVPVDAGVLLQV